MNLKSLHKIAKQGESQIIEFKRTTGQRTEAMKTVCAMLNSNGGHVIFGVSDQGEIKGQEVSAKTTKPEPKRACAKCEWWKNHGNDLGSCRLLPPTLRHDSSPSGIWPTTLATDWCGNFDERKAAK